MVPESENPAVWALDPLGCQGFGIDLMMWSLSGFYAAQWVSRCTSVGF